MRVLESAHSSLTVHDGQVLFPLLPRFSLGFHGVALYAVYSMIFWTPGLPVAPSMARNDRRTTASWAWGFVCGAHLASLLLTV